MTGGAGLHAHFRPVAHQGLTSGQDFLAGRRLHQLDLLRFYRSVFPRLAPHVHDRMLMLERCPEGIIGDCFFQKGAPKNLAPGTPITQRLRIPGRTFLAAAGRSNTQSEG
jgi:DNA primase